MYERCKPLGVKKCAYCGKEFTIYHRVRLNKENICCSIECRSKYRKAQNLNCECAVCGKLLHRRPGKINNTTQPFTCSRVCLGKLRTLIYKGESNPNFRNRGEKNPLHISGLTKHCNYLWEYAPDHPFAPLGSSHRVRKHRLVAEQFLLTDENSIEIDGKRYLRPEYDVHHIDGNKHNNVPNNLMVLTRSEHCRIHAIERRSTGK